MKFRRALAYSIFPLLCTSCMSPHVPLVVSSDHPASPDGLTAPMYEESSTLRDPGSQRKLTPPKGMPKTDVHEHHNGGEKRENK